MSSSDGSADSDTLTPIAETPSYYKQFYTSAEGQNVTAADLVRILGSIISTNSADELTISEIQTALGLLSDSIVLLNSQIEYLHRLNGLLIFELIDQGIKIQSKELIEELNYIK